MTEKTIKLKMKKRGAPKVFLPYEQAYDLVANNDRDTIWRLFKSMAENPAQEHDKDFMVLIVNFTPQEGQPMMEIARWARLALKIDKLDITKEETLEITSQEADMIIDRLRKPDFKVRSTSTGFYKFILDLEDAIGEEVNAPKEVEDNE